MKCDVEIVRLALVATAVSGSLLVNAGCDSLARTQGKFPIASSFGEEAIGESGNPLSGALWVDKLDKNGNVVYRPKRDKNGKEVCGSDGRLIFEYDSEDNKIPERVPLVRVGYRHPGSGRLINTREQWDSTKKFQKESYYMVIDVTNAVRDPRLGAGNNEVLFRERLRDLAEMLVMAADWNGEVYWRHLTTFLETQKAAQSTGKAALGSAIAAGFISPVLGASLAGAALVTDTFVEEFTSSLNVDEYAKLRDAAATYRAGKRDTLFNAVNDVGSGEDRLNRVLQLANDYAFTYSIKGALQAVSKTDEMLREYLITGESSWRTYFDDEIERYQIERYDRGEIEKGTDEYYNVEAMKKTRNSRLESFQKYEDDVEKAYRQEALAKIQAEWYEAQVRLENAKQELVQEQIETKQKLDEAEKLGIDVSDVKDDATGDETGDEGTSDTEG